MTVVSSRFISVVARLRNDREIAAAFVREIVDVLRPRYENYEIVLVDDGSRDGTVATLSELLKTEPGIRIVRLSRTFGDEIAYSAGLETAIGDVIVTLQPDTDLPSLLPDLVEGIKGDVGVVYGVNAAKAKNPSLGSNLFHYATRRFFDLEIPRNATQLRALSRPALNALMGIKDRFRYLRAFMPYIGFRIQPFEYTPVSRTGKVYQDNVFKRIDMALTIITSSTTRPLRLVSWLGLAGGLLNLLYIAYVLLIAIFKKHVAEGWVTLSFEHAVMFMFIFLILAVTTEYIGRILNETQNRPLYFVAEELNSSILIPNRERRNVVSDSE